MLKKILENLTIFLVPIYIRILIWTSKKYYLGKENIQVLINKDKAFIISLWHCCIIGGAGILDNMYLHGLASQSRDGEIISRILEKFKIFNIRGSSTRGGVSALKEMISAGKENKRLAITPDGPKGPAFKVKMGVVTIASKTGLPIIPFHYEALKQKIINSWDQMRLPFPLFNKLIIRYGEPIYVPENLTDEDYEYYISLVEKKMLENIEKVQKEKQILEKT